MLNKIRSKFRAIGQGQVRLNLDKSIGHLILDNPAKRNALSPKMMVELAEMVEQLEHSKQMTGLIISGSNESFCSGFGNQDF